MCFNDFYLCLLPSAWLLGHFLSEKYYKTIHKHVYATYGIEPWCDRRYPLLGQHFVVLIKSGVKNFYCSSITKVCCYKKHKYYWDLKNFIFLNFYTGIDPSWWEWPISAPYTAAWKYTWSVKSLTEVRKYL